MTPFGQAIRKLREERNVTQKQMAQDLGISAAYLSALEHGHRSKPSWQFVQQIIGYFNIIWDEAEELMNLAGLSDPKISIKTSGLHAEATKTANMLAKSMDVLTQEDLSKIIEIIELAIKRDKETR